MPKKKDNKATSTDIQNDPIAEEMVSETQSEAMPHHSHEASIDASATDMDEEAEKATTVEESADASEAAPAELVAISSETESAKELNDSKTKKSPKPESKSKKQRSAAYLSAKKLVEIGKLYSLEEGIETVKKTSLAKFDAAVELHIKLTVKKSKGSTESSKGTFHLPHGTGKNKKIVILTEELIDEIAKTKKIDFDVALATPALMPKVAKIAKILGPKGKMPDPKSGTVTSDPEKAIAEINSGRAEYRIDSTNNIHQMVGRVSWETTKLMENINAALSSFPKSRLARVFLTSSMGPSVVIDTTYLK